MCGGPFRAILEPILRKFGAVLAAPSRRSRQCPRFHLRLNNCPEPRLNHSATIEPLRGCARSTCILLQRRTVPRRFPNALEPLRGRSRPPCSGSRVVAPQPGRVGGDAEGAATCGRAAPRAQCRAQRARDARPPRVFSDVCPGLGAAAQPPARHLPAVRHSAPPPNARPARRRLRRGFRGRFRRAAPRTSFPRHLQGRPARRRQRPRWRPMGRPGGACEPWRSAANGSRPVEAAPSAAPAATEAARPRQISSPRWQARRLDMHRRGGLGAGRLLVPYEFI